MDTRARLQLLTATVVLPPILRKRGAQMRTQSRRRNGQWSFGRYLAR
ncbi:MAG: hypothetical protein M3466_10950 [Gemmatimonadota bacterium]|nr:hypothetical protein [Gemmatimonadota bacterium]